MNSLRHFKRPTTYQLFTIFAALFLVLALIAPPDVITVERYHLGGGSYRVLLLATVVLPAILTWYAAFYGFEQLKAYHAVIAKSKEGQAFAYLVKASRWIALYLPIVALVSLALMGVANALPGFQNASLIISNYVAILISIVAFGFASTGARLLANTANVRPNLLKTRSFSLGFIVMGVVYSYFIVSRGIGGTHPYGLPIFWLLLTVVIPYFFAWFMGLLAVLDIDSYATHVPGVLYRKALRLLSIGLLTIIGSAVLMQYVSSVNTERGRLVLGGILVIRYALYAAVATGFMLIGKSAKKLQQIEKI